MTTPSDRAARDAARVASARARTGGTPPDPGDGGVDPAPVDDLAPRRPVAGGDGGSHGETTEFLLQSIRDLDAELAAGDIDEGDHRALRDDYTRRAAVALRAEAAGRTPPAPTRRRRPAGQWIAVVVGIVGFAVLAGVLVAQAAGQRQQGEGVTGEITRTPTQAAAGCIELTVAWSRDGGVPTEAFACYEEVLEEDPDNAVALTYLGWTQYLLARQVGSGLDAEDLARLFLQVDENLDLAVEADPDYADARAFQVVFAAGQEQWEEAATHLAAFDQLDAPADMVSLVAGVRQEVEDGLAGGAGTPTTGPPSSTTGPP